MRESSLTFSNRREFSSSSSSSCSIRVSELSLVVVVGSELSLVFEGKDVSLVVEWSELSLALFDVMDRSLNSLRLSEPSSFVSLEDVKEQLSRVVSFERSDVSLVYERVDPSPEFDWEFVELSSSLHVVHEVEDSVGFLQGMMGCTEEDVRDCVKEEDWEEELREGEEWAVAVGLVSDDSFHSPKLFNINL